MIHIEDKKECCGCWACYNACPKHCIGMKEDEEGFRYPVVDASLCIDCGLCEKVCPVIHADKADTPHAQQGFLAQHKDEDIRKESTSGGAFTAIASWIIRQGASCMAQDTGKALSSWSIKGWKRKKTYRFSATANTCRATS